MRLHRARRGILPLLLLPLLVSTVASAQDATEMRWRFQPGEVFDYQIRQAVNQQMVAEGQTIETEMTMVMDLAWRVDAVDRQGTATIEQTFKRMRVSMEGAGLKASYDTDNRQDVNPVLAGLAKLFNEFVGISVMVKMDPRGEIVDTEVDPKLIEALQRAGGGPMGEMFTEEGIEEMITSSATLAVLPREAVKPGDTWQDSKEIADQMLGKRTLEVNNTFEGVEKRDGRSVAVFAFSVDFSEADLPEEVEGVKVDIKDQKMGGTFYFDPQLGKMTDSETTSEMSVEIVVEGQALQRKSATTATATLKPASAER